jgi:hypothetical protein
MKLTDKQNIMLEVLKKSAGNVSVACSKVGIDRGTHYNWSQQNPHYKKAVDDIQESLIDLAESKLMQKINDGDTTSTIFFLKTKGKSRGYVERTEQAISGSLGVDKTAWTLED